MTLDFTTLYVVILLNSIGIAVVWAGVAISYPKLVAARFWLAALVCTSFGGIMLFIEAAESARFWTFLGIAAIGLGYSLIWQGVQVFLGRSARWPLAMAYMTACVIALALAGDTRAGQNVVFSAIQIPPMIFSALALKSDESLGLGTRVALVAAGIALCGQSVEVISNLMRIAGSLSDEEYFSFAAWLLMATIIGSSTLNFGFLLMAIDRLNSELAALATRDDLTGLLNRRGMRDRTAMIAKRAKRQGEKVCVVMIDLDGLKVINDTYGHGAGDACLVHVAGLAKGMLRPADVLARLGGDEFAVLLPVREVDAAEGFAEALARLVSSTPVIHIGVVIETSVSVGLSVWDPASGKQLSDHLQDADAALYETKRSGRNGYSVYDPLRDASVPTAT